MFFINSTTKTHYFQGVWRCFHPGDHNRVYIPASFKQEGGIDVIGKTTTKQGAGGSPGPHLTA
jgi:hypothetical protein